MLKYAFIAFISLLASQTLANEQVFINGAIYTVNPKKPWAEAVHINNGVIEFVGDNAAALANASQSATVTNLHGKMMLPGFHDVHTHPLEARSPFSGTCLLNSEEEDAENFIDELRACAPYQQGGTDWVLGSGHSVFTLLNSERPPVEILDESIPNRPAAMMEATSHSIWVNSLALEYAGIDKNTRNPPGGVIVRDSNTGNPTGILFDSAGDLVFDHAWAATPTIKQFNYEGLLSALAELNKHGITSVVSGRTYWRRQFQDAWLRAERENTLTVRAMLGLWAYPSQPDATQIPALQKLYRKDVNNLLNIRQIKVYADGILINTTAAMQQPYREVLGNIPSNNGLNYFSQDRLARYIQALPNFDFHIHAIGDRGVHEALNAIQTAQQTNARHRLTHLEIVNPKDYPRFTQLNVTADMQVAGDFTQPSHWPEARPFIGNRANKLVPLKDLHQAKARITLSSDWDVSTLNPFVGIQNALTRAPQNLPDLAAAIQAYTLNGAYVMRQETITGSIETGKQADLIVLSQNIFDLPVQKIHQTQVLMTILNGKIIYQWSEQNG